MSDEKTTKEILKEKMPRKERTPLYNPEALKKIEMQKTGYSMI